MILTDSLNVILKTTLYKMSLGSKRDQYAAMTSSSSSFFPSFPTFLNQSKK